MNFLQNIKGKQEFKTYAYELGFDVVGVTSPSIPARNKERLDYVVENKLYGEMEFLARNTELRKDPKLYWDKVKSVIVCGINYYYPNPKESGKGYISTFARGEDYHDVIRKKLQQLGDFIGCEYRACVDTSPVMEKALAEQAGIGWIGRNSLVINKDFGPWLFLGVLLVDAEYGSDEPVKNGCGNCRVCIDSCPANALTDKGLQPDKCLAYLLVEHKSEIPETAHEVIGSNIFGCDTCLRNCPWHSKAQITRCREFHPKEGLDRALEDWHNIDEAEFRKTFANSTIKRLKLPRFLRNVGIALRNNGKK